MSSLCQVRADTNLGIEKFYFSIFVPLFEIVLRSGCCGGGALFNPILTGYKSTPRLSIGSVRLRTACQLSERVPRRPAALKQCSVPCPCCLASQSERALRLRSAACQGTTSTLCRLSGHHIHALSRIPSAPTWDKMLLCGKICHKNGNLGNEKNQKPS